MQYVFAPKREVWWPIEVAVVKDDGEGTIEYAQLKLRYKLLTRDEMFDRYEREFKALSRENSDRMVDRILARFRNEKEEQDFLVERVVDWKGPVDQHGNAIPFSRQNFEAVLKADPRFFPAAFDGLIKASQEAPRKN